MSQTKAQLIDPVLSGGVRPILRLARRGDSEPAPLAGVDRSVLGMGPLPWEY